MRRRKRLPDGTLGPYESVLGNEPSPEERIKQLESENVTNMLAMTDLFETNVTLREENNQLMLAITDLYEQIIGGDS